MCVHLRSRVLFRAADFPAQHYCSCKTVDSVTACMANVAFVLESDVSLCPKLACNIMWLSYAASVKCKWTCLQNVLKRR